MALKIEKVNFSYKSFKLKNINFSFKNTGIYLISGPSGSGKSTLLKIIGGFLKPDSGNIIYNGKKVYFGDEDFLLNYRKKIIGFSYQKLNLIEQLSVNDNLELKAKFLKEKIDLDWKKYLLDFFEISNLVNKKISEISGGQALRVSLVKAVLLKPKILLLDEAESWLDEKLTKKLFEFEKEYSKENLVIISSHYFGNKTNKLEIEEFKETLKN